jgi:hypothetical protein
MGRTPKGVHVLEQADGPPKIYVFRDWQGAVANAAAGEHVIQAFGSVDALNTYFGGHMTFGRVTSSNEFLGVWGNRNTGRFRRILRERLGDLEVVHSKPPARHSGTSLTRKRLSADERSRLELSFAPKR